VTAVHSSLSPESEERGETMPPVYTRVNLNPNQVRDPSQKS
jgi:hypothetical protein